MRQRHKDNLLIKGEQVEKRLMLDHSPWNIKQEPYPHLPIFPMPVNIAKIFLIHFYKAEVYNAWDEDIAVVNVFFGKETVMGEESFSPKGYLFPMDFQSLRGASEWALSTSSPPSEACLGSALVSASSPSSRLCTGLSPGSLGICSSERNSVCKEPV